MGDVGTDHCRMLHGASLGAGGIQHAVWVMHVPVYAQGSHSTGMNCCLDVSLEWSLASRLFAGAGQRLRFWR